MQLYMLVKIKRNSLRDDNRAWNGITILKRCLCLGKVGFAQASAIPNWINEIIQKHVSQKYIYKKGLVP